MVIRRPSAPPPPITGSPSGSAPPAAPPPARTPRGLVQLGRYGPVAAAYAVFQSLVGVLPGSLSEDAARYALAGTAGISIGIIVRLSALLAVRRADREGAVGDGRTAHPAAHGELDRLVDGTLDALLRCRSTVDDPVLGRLTGWPHFVEEGEAGQRATAISTAYGLHIGLTVQRGEGLLEHPRLVDTLWRLRLADGGWAARTGAGVSRAEVTALVVGVLSRAGADPVRLAESVGALERMLVPGVDPEGLSRTYIVSAAIRGLLRAAPRSPVLPRLRAELVTGAVRDDDRGGLLCWGHSLDSGPGAGSGAVSGSVRTLVPSPVHTAHAVVALARLERALGTESHARLSMEQGAEWLVRHGGLAHQTEHVRRPAAAGHGVDHVVIRHFSAAWVAKALLSAGPASPEAGAHLAAALDRVWTSQNEGVWEWDDDRDRRPIWMTYQGLSVLTAHALGGYGRRHGV